MSAQRPPTYPPPHAPGLSAVLERNIQALQARRKREEVEATLQDRIADRVTRFTGSMRFVYLHLILFGGWILVNLGWLPIVRPWDPSFVVLAMIASVETEVDAELDVIRQDVAPDAVLDEIEATQAKNGQE